jgi:DNA modification methylase
MSELLNKVLQGDCLVSMKLLPDNSVDSIVTDPPYHLVSIVKRFGKEGSAPAQFGTDGAFSRASKGFMGKQWDGVDENGIGIAQNVELWKECLRVLKPGGHLLSFGGTRTYHRMASAIEDAGFEVRDQMVWCYGQGFPKSLNISLQIKKKYNIGLCTCNVFEPMIELGYENTNTTNNKGNGDYVGQGLSDEAQVERGGDKKTQSETGDKIISGKSGVWNSDGEVCELWETDTEKKQGLEKVGEVVLQQGVPQPINEKEGYGDIKIRGGVESNQTESQRERRDLQMLRKEGQEQSTSSPFDTIQNGREEYNGESSESLSELSQQDRENNRKRIEQIKNDCGTEEWNNLSRFICSKCHCIKKDIGGTALKPSIEPICMARKPLSEKTVALNVLKYGTGGINIDESRVGTEDMSSQWDREWNDNNGELGKRYSQNNRERNKSVPVGRFPANLIHDGSNEVVELFPNTKSGSKPGQKGKSILGSENGETSQTIENAYGDSGSASRFFKTCQFSQEELDEIQESTTDMEEKLELLGISQKEEKTDISLPIYKSAQRFAYVAKASKSERNRGCEELEEKEWIKNACVANRDIRPNSPNSNNHPTVKPIALMEYLVKLVSKEGAVVLDPFAGSFSTGVACINLNRQFIGMEMDAEYIKIGKARMEQAQKDKDDKGKQQKLNL